MLCGCSAVPKSFGGHFFSLYLPLCDVRKRFEWKVSGDREVRELGHATGMKLVRVRYARLVAVLANVNMALKKKGKMGYLLTDGDGSGSEFHLMAVVSLVAFLEVQGRANMCLYVWL